jgi:chlorobactene glucosyltransferase
MRKKLIFLPEETEPLSTPKVSVLVPARNESRILSQSLQSLLNLEYPDFEVIVIDDHSEDNTREIAESFQKTDPRLMVISSAELPPGWRGKSWALQQGIGVAKGSWLLLTDADVIHQPDSLKSALAKAQREKVDLLSILAHIECGTFWEKIVLPAFAIILCMIRPLHKSNDPSSPVVLVAGGFILVKTLILKHLGGYSQIRSSVIEDLRLGELLKFQGYRILTVISRSRLISTRMYHSVQELWEGLTRHAFEGSGHNPLKMTLSIVAAYLLIVTPAVAIFAGLLLRNWFLITLSVFPVFTMFSLQTFANRQFEVPRRYFFGFPLATAVYGLMMFHSMISYYFRGGNVWKGRRYGKTAAGSSAP